MLHSANIGRLEQLRGAKREEQAASSSGRASSLNTDWQLCTPADQGGQRRSLRWCSLSMASPPLAPAWLVALLCRLLNALCSRAFFQPDEYWQNLEVAHKWIYGYGYQTWEWRSLATSAATMASATAGDDGSEWGKAMSTWADVRRTGGQGGIRSPLSVAGTALVYIVLKATSMDDGTLLASSYFSSLFAFWPDKF